MKRVLAMLLVATACVPAPLAAPAQAPTINGPSARSSYGGVL
jgi:hypothetical protein